MPRRVTILSLVRFSEASKTSLTFTLDRAMHLVTASEPDGLAQNQSTMDMIDPFFFMETINLHH